MSRDRVRVNKKFPLKVMENAMKPGFVPSSDMEKDAVKFRKADFAKFMMVYSRLEQLHQQARANAAKKKEEQHSVDHGTEKCTELAEQLLAEWKNAEK